jgi:hypothetical protein
MKKRGFLVAALLLSLTVAAGHAASPAETEKSPPSPDPKTPPGIAAAQAISTITGVAISPLLGVSVVGAWDYFKHVRTPVEQRKKLHWYAQPWFWIPGLVLVGLVFLKDVLGTGTPPALKKPLDVAEAFENKISALVVAGLFVPLIASVFGSSVGGGDGSLYQGTGLAAFDPWALLNVLTVPAAIVAFFVVWLVAHVINVLILMSPWGVIDAVLKSSRLFLLATLTVTSMAAPYAGAALSLVIIVICYCLAGWSFRLMIFGSVFGWDLVTLRCKRFRPDEQSNRAFLGRAVEKTPVRTMGRLRRDEQGQLVLEYRPWLVLPPRVVKLPPGKYVVGRGLIFPELVLADDNLDWSIATLPPRWLGHEQELARLYGLEGVRDAGLAKGFSAFRLWLKESIGIGHAPAPG